VDVEDLLNEALVGVDRGIEEDQGKGGAERCGGADREPSEALPEKVRFQDF
jgi:hypothetical protein